LAEGDPKVNYFCVDDGGVLWFEDHLVVPKDNELRKKVFDEAHTSKYSIHPGNTKMYHDLKVQFWWTRMKRETACYSCLEMGRHQHGFHCGSASICP
jgi:hypothetical protein